MTAPIRDLPTAVRALGALPVPLGRRDIADLDVPADRLEQRIRDLLAAPCELCDAPTPNTPEEDQ